MPILTKEDFMKKMIMTAAILLAGLQANAKVVAVDTELDYDYNQVRITECMRNSKGGDSWQYTHVSFDDADTDETVTFNLDKKASIQRYKLSIKAKKFTNGQERKSIVVQLVDQITGEMVDLNTSFPTDSTGISMGNDEEGCGFGEDPKVEYPRLLLSLSYGFDPVPIN